MKPALSATFNGTTPVALGPAYSFRENTGTTVADDSTAAGPAGTLGGGATWATGSYGPVIRTAADGDFVTFPDSAAFRTASAGVTIMLGVKPSSFTGDLDHTVWSAFVNQQFGYASSTFGIWNTGTGGVPGSICGTVGGLHTPYAGPALVAGTAYILVLRAQGGSPLNLRVYNRATGAQVGSDSVSDTALASGNVLIDTTGNPITIGRLIYGGGTKDAPGDYEFFFVSPTYLSDAATDTFAANPYENYTVVSSDILLSGPSTGVPGVLSSFTTSLVSGVHPGSTVVVTPHIAGMSGAFSPTTVSLTDSTRSATFTFTPTNATADGTAGTVSITNGGGLANPSGSAFTAAYSPIPLFAAFESTMGWAGTGGAHPYPQSSSYAADADDHYDIINIMEQIRAYTGSSSWDTQIAAAIAHYREQGVFGNGGAEGGHHAYADGLLANYERTGDTHSRDAAILIAYNAAGSSDASPDWYGFDQSGSREIAFSIKTKLATEALGCAHRAKLEEMVACALGHISQWTAAPGSRQWSVFVRPFMVGLTAEALIDYWTRYRSAPDTGSGSAGNLTAQIPAAIKSALDWLWANAWQAGPWRDGASAGSTWDYGGFQYTDHDLRTAFADILATVASATSGTQFRGASSLSSQDDYYHFAAVRFTSGPLSGQQAVCSGYTGSTREFAFNFPGQSFGAAPSAGDAFSVIYNGTNPSTGTDINGLSADTDSGASLNPLIAPAYAWYYWYTVAVLGARDNTYRQRFDDCMSGTYTLRIAPPTQKLYNQTYKWLIRGVRWRQRGDSEWTAATALTLTGPGSAGAVHAMSDRFTVAFSGSNRTTSAPIVVTFSDGGAGGTFFPPTATLTAERPSATTRYRALTSGAKTISVTSSPTLIYPSSITYTTTGTKVIATAASTSFTAIAGPSGTPVPFTIATVPTNSTPPPTADLTGGLVMINLYGTPTGVFGYDTMTPMGQPTYGWISGDNPSLTMNFVPANTSPTTISFVGDGTISSPSSVVFNAATDTAAPTPLDASTNSAGNVLTVHFTETGSAPVLPASGVTGLTLTATGGVVTLSGGTISDTTYTGTMSRAVNSGETLTLGYASGNITDSATTPNALASFSGFSVTNNSTVSGPFVAGTLTFTPATPVFSASSSSGGTGSVTRQLQRSTSPGSGFADVSGQTGATPADSTAVSGTIYYYREKYTDSASAVVYSSVVVAQVYPGGPVSALASGTVDSVTASALRAGILADILGSTMHNEVIAIKNVSDKLGTALQTDGGSGWQFTVLALAHGPTGGGSSPDPWAINLPGSYTQGTAGYILSHPDKTGYKLAPDGLDSITVETGINARQALSPILAASGGVVSGAGTGVITIKAANSSTTRITATCDNNGNRSNVTLAIPS